MDVRQLIYFTPRDEAQIVIPQLNTAGWKVHTAASEEQALRLIEQHDIGVGLVPLSDVEQLYHTARPWSDCDRLSWVALISPEARADPQFWPAIATYFFDFHTLPIDFPRLQLTLGHAEGMARLQRQQDSSDARFDDYEMVGESEVMKTLFTSIRKVASVDAPVLISGESGTGKELAARAIHERSIRATGPFVAVNCGALPANLIQSELFGHEKGAFTGADQRKIGFIEKAQGGTLFLDEMGDLPLDLQANMLRFLQEQTIERVGGREPIKVDARIISATNIDLQQAVAAQRFREDLYFRLNVLALLVPSLRERGPDVELLAKFFFNKFIREQHSSVKGFSARSLQAIRDHNWPGNVRELINRVRRAIVMTEHRLIRPSDLGLDGNEMSISAFALDQVRADAETRAIRETLKAARYNVSRSARTLGISRVTLYRLMAKHNIIV
jgi:DNA-binding NtrC family response regulator